MYITSTAEVTFRGLEEEVWKLSNNERSKWDSSS